MTSLKVTDEEFLDAITDLKKSIDDLKASNVTLHTTINKSNMKWTILNILLVSVAVLVSSAALINSLKW